MPFDPIDHARQAPPDRPDPFASTGGQEVGLLIGAALLLCALLFLALFPFPLVLAADAYDYLRGAFASG